MPTYEYRCRECGDQLEAVQAFTDAPLTECPNCGGALRKVFGSVGIAFKGSGFYRNDSRSGSSSSSSKDKEPASSSTSSPSDSSSNGSSSKDTKSSSSSSSSTGSSTAAAAAS